MLAVSIHWRSDEERRNLLISFATSLAVHAVGLLTWLSMATALLALSQRLDAERDATNPPTENRTPTIFVEVSPEQVVEEPPENTPYYSVANTRASNPDPADMQDTQVDGSQTFMVKTFDVLQPQPELLQPTPPPDLVPPISSRPFQASVIFRYCPSKSRCRQRSTKSSPRRAPLTAARKKQV